MAQWESLEEAGCEIRELVLACRFLTSPGITSETVSVFIGHGESDGRGDNYGLAEEGEDICAFVLGFDEAMAKLEFGQIANSPAVAALYWLDWNREDLRERWNSNG